MIAYRKVFKGNLNNMMLNKLGGYYIKKIIQVLLASLLFVSLFASACSCSSSTIATGSIPNLGGLELINSPYLNPGLSGYWEHPNLYVNIFIIQDEIPGFTASTSGGDMGGGGRGGF